ncbi:hypothetical protein R5H30_01600 [Sulfitobacter sp. D35]|uniref:hypothetical protein n=1 Tax=Sulfitobacter sp. D35 TaxID=3083252 RepID=UPI00296F9686|nr:hypothetical protein [Sulfitobacter sp. D35]MDW4496660.1 hypothetical protein [Sulfitobacter sp. D35]
MAVGLCGAIVSAAPAGATDRAGLVLTAEGAGTVTAICLLDGGAARVELLDVPMPVLHRLGAATARCEITLTVPTEVILSDGAGRTSRAGLSSGRLILSLD